LIIKDIVKLLEEIVVQMKIMNETLNTLSLLPDVKELAEKRKERLGK